MQLDYLEKAGEVARLFERLTELPGLVPFTGRSRGVVFGSPYASVVVYFPKAERHLENLLRGGRGAEQVSLCLGAAIPATADTCGVVGTLWGLSSVKQASGRVLAQIQMPNVPVFQTGINFHLDEGAIDALSLVGFPQVLFHRLDIPVDPSSILVLGRTHAAG